MTCRLAQATECSPASGYSTCFDSTDLWLRPGRASFFGIAPVRPVRHGTFSFGIATSYASRPVVLTAASSDPSGRELEAIEFEVDTNFLWAYSPLDRFELTLALPFVPYRRGHGLTALTSQRGTPLAGAAVRDPRLGVGFLMFDSVNLGVSLSPRFDLVLPVADRHQLAGEAGPVLAPSLSGELRLGIVMIQGEVGARLRDSTHVGSATLASQGTFSLGTSADILGPLLAVTLEAWMLPSFTQTERHLASGARSAHRLVPAEWLAGLRSRPGALQDVTLMLAVGTGLPLSTEVRTNSDGTSDTDRFVGVTAAGFRTIAAASYAPDSPQHK